MRALAILLSSSIALTACAAPKPDIPMSKAPARMETIVQLLPECPTQTTDWGQPKPEFAGLLLPIVAVLGEKLISKGIDYGVQFLQERQDALKAKSQSRDTEEFYLIGATETKIRFSCIVFARGEVGSKLMEGPEDEYFTNKRLELLRRDDSLEPNEKINLVRAPVVYAEFVIVSDADSTATPPIPARNFYLRPIFLDYRDTAAKRKGKQKSLVFSFDFSRPGSASASEAQTLFAKFLIDFDEVAYGTRWTYSDLVTKVSAPQELPPTITKDKKPDTALLTVLGTLAEAEDASSFEKMLTGAAVDSKDKVAETLGKAFVKWINSMTPPEETK